VDGSDDQIDELMLQSTPNTEPAPIAELFSAQMGLSLPPFFLLWINLVLITDVPQFPRSRKIGGNAGIKPHILAGKALASLRSRFFVLNHLRRLGTFLQPLLEKTIRTTMQINEKPVIAQCSSPEPSSLFGQPPSALECPDREVISHGVHDDLDIEIANLYKGQTLQNLIMDEVIDEKQNFLMKGQRLDSPPPCH
jgi:hypothetical protein